MLKKIIKEYGVEIVAGTIILVNSLILKKDIKRVKKLRNGDYIRFIK